ncbi:MAG: hypothetical protein ACXWJA_05080 [Caldimonas sp.]
MSVGHARRDFVLEALRPSRHLREMVARRRQGRLGAVVRPRRAQAAPDIGKRPPRGVDVPNSVVDPPIDDGSELASALGVSRDFGCTQPKLVRTAGPAAGVPYRHRETPAIVRLRPVQDVIVEVLLLAKVEDGTEVVLAAEDDGAVRMRVRHLAQPQQAETVLLRLLDDFEREDHDVGHDALEVGDSQLRTRRNLDAVEVVEERSPHLRGIVGVVAGDQDACVLRAPAHDAPPDPGP